MTLVVAVNSAQITKVYEPSGSISIPWRISLDVAPLIETLAVAVALPQLLISIAGLTMGYPVSPAIVKQLGVTGFLEFVRETCANPWLSPEWFQAFHRIPFRMTWD